MHWDPPRNQGARVQVQGYNRTRSIFEAFTMMRKDPTCVSAPPIWRRVQLSPALIMMNAFVFILSPVILFTFPPFFCKLHICARTVNQSSRRLMSRIDILTSGLIAHLRVRHQGCFLYLDQHEESASQSWFSQSEDTWGQCFWNMHLPALFFGTSGIACVEINLVEHIKGRQMGWIEDWIVHLVHILTCVLFDAVC